MLGCGALKVYVVAMSYTFCIDKSSSAELSESTNSMYDRYRCAAKCYVFLADVSMRDSEGIYRCVPMHWEVALRRGKWFTRGWTLQELLAPEGVEFYSCEGSIWAARSR
jgi:hypothetical protein